MRLALLLLAMTLTSRLVHADNASTPNTNLGGVSFGLKLARKSYFLGENVVAYLGITNHGEKQLTIDPFLGPDGGPTHSGSASTVRVEVIHLDETPNDKLARQKRSTRRVKPWTVGVKIPFLAPGETKYLALPIAISHEMKRAERLQVQVDTALKLPLEQMNVRLTKDFDMAMPSTEQAQKIVEDSEKPRLTSWDNRSADYQPPSDESMFAFPAYLPALINKVQTGQAKYISTIGEIESPGMLVWLLSFLNMDDAPAKSSAKAIAKRLTFKEVQLEGKGWREKFRTQIFDHASKAIFSDDPTVFGPAVDLLSAQQNRQYLPVIKQAMEPLLKRSESIQRFTADGDGLKITPEFEPLFRNFNYLKWAAVKIVGIGRRFSPSHENSAAALYLDVNHDAGCFGTPPFVSVLRQGAVHPSPMIRARAVDAWRKHPDRKLEPGDINLARKLLHDNDPEIRFLACWLVAGGDQISLKTDLVEVMENDSVRYVSIAASNALKQMDRLAKARLAN